MLAVHEALDSLGEHSPHHAQLGKLRYFAGLRIEEAAMALGISERTAKRYRTFARPWLLEAIHRDRQAV